MSFDLLSKMGMGAAAGVVADRAGYVDAAVSQLSEQYGTTADAFGLPAIPDASGLIVSNASEFQLPTSVGEVTDQIGESLAYAKEVMQQYMAYIAQEPGMGEVTGGAGKALSGGVQRTGNSQSSQSDSSSARALTTTFFLAGLGSAFFVYYLCPEKFNKECDKYIVVVRKVLHGWSVKAEQYVRDMGIKDKLESAHLVVRENVSKALLAAAPLATDAEIAVRRAVADVHASVKPVVIDIVNYARPKLEATVLLAREKALATKVVLEAVLAKALELVQEALNGDGKKK